MAADHITKTPNSRYPHPPGTWSAARKRVRRILAPVERFVAVEAASGIVLTIAAAAAIVWANSPWRASYSAIWHIPIGFQAGYFHFERDLHFWINDGLMTIFFFVIGLEIRREIHSGELSDFRRAALPIAAAVGGMLVPALIFLALNAGRPSANGWAIPMATDIAFAVGALALLGKRVRPALRILLLALAVIDDVGAIVVIAMFYSAAIAPAGFVILLLGILGIVALQAVGVRSHLAYVAPAATVWAGAYVAGIHPTLAGVIVGFMTPVQPWYGPEGFIDATEAGIRAVRSNALSDDRGLLRHLDSLRTANREALSPLERLQRRLHRWVAFGIMPLFAFANAGVPILSVSLTADAVFLFAGVAIGLAVGKPVGILSVSLLAVRTGLVALPSGLGLRHLTVCGLAGGIGFTMALFIAQLAFTDGVMLETSKLAILSGSGIAAVMSLVVGYRMLKTTEESSTLE